MFITGPIRGPFWFSFDGLLYDKSGQSDVRRNAQQNQQNTNSQFTEQQRMSAGRANDQYDTGVQRGNQAFTGMAWAGGNNNYANNGSQDAAQNLSGTGGVDLSNINAGYQGVVDKPISDATTAQTNRSVGNLNTIGTQGGVNRGATRNFMGGGVYNDFAANGGFNPAQAGNYMRQATSGVPAMYQQLQNQMAQRRNIQGGYSPAFGASSAALAREASRGMNNSVQSAQNNLTQQINANRLAGAGGLQSGQGLLTNAQISGNTNAANTQLSQEQLANSTRLAGLGGLTNAQQLAQQGRIAGTGLLTSQASGLNNTQLRALEGEAGLSTNNLANANNLYGQNLAGIGNQAAANIGYGNLMERNAENTRGPMDYLSQGLGMGSSVLGGLGGLRNVGGGGGSGVGNPGGGFGDSNGGGGGFGSDNGDGNGDGNSDGGGDYSDGNGDPNNGGGTDNGDGGDGFGDVLPRNRFRMSSIRSGY